MSIGSICLGLLIVLVPSAILAKSKGQDPLDLGTRLYQEGRYQEARRLFQEATDLDPGLLKAWENLGWAYQRTGGPQKALEIWDNVLTIDPQNLRLANAAGSLASELGQHQRAASYYQTSLRHDPTQVDVRLKLARSEFQVGRVREALNQLRRVERVADKDPALLVTLARHYEEFGDRRRAISLLETSLAIQSSSTPRTPQQRLLPKHPRRIRQEISSTEAVVGALAELFTRQGDEDYQKGQYREAEQAYRQALAWRPRAVAVLTNLGYALAKQQRYPQALRVWKASLSQQPEQKRLYPQMAKAYEQIGKVPQALRWYQRASQAFPSSKNVMFRVFDLALRNGELPLALQAGERLLKDSQGLRDWVPRLANAFIRHEAMSQGIALFQQWLPKAEDRKIFATVISRLYTKRAGQQRAEGRIDAAVSDYREALRMDNRNRIAYRDLGWVYWGRQQWEACEAVWGEYRETFENVPQPHNLLLRLYLHQRRFDEAIRAARVSLVLVPEQPDVQLGLAKAFFWSNRFRETDAVMAELVGRYPDHVPIQYFWGELLMQRRDFIRGLDQWQRVVAMGVDAPRAHYYLIKSLYENERYAEALKMAKKYLQRHEPYRPLLQLMASDALFRNRKVEAARWYEAILKLSEDHPGTFLTLAGLYQDLDQPDRAQALLARAQERFPQEVEVRLAAADLSLRRGKYQPALEAYLAVQRLNPDNRRAFFGMLNAYKGMHRFQDAKRLVLTANKDFLKGYEVELEVASLLSAQRSLDEAKRRYLHVVQATRTGTYVPILLYHGLSPHPRSKNLWVANFADQLRSLKEAGYTAISVQELAAMVDQTLPFPDKPVVITFDDARRDAFVLGDPVLAAHGMKATMFVPTARIYPHHPFFADWEMIRRYAGTGRWDVQAHGHHAHDLIPIDPSGKTGTFLTNYRWMDAWNRQETPHEFLARLKRDYQTNLEVLRAELPGGKIVGYAFPFSEAGQSSSGTADQARSLNEELLRTYFRFGFIQDMSGFNWMAPGSQGPPMLRRLTVPREWDGLRLVEHLAEHHPANLAQVALAKTQYWNGDYTDAETTWKTVLAKEPRLEPKAKIYLANISYQGGRYWESERLLDSLADDNSSLHSQKERLRKKVLWKNRPRVFTDFQFFQDSNDRTNFSEALTGYFPLRLPVEFGLRAAGIHFRENGRPDFDGGEVRPSVTWRIAPAFVLEGAFRNRWFVQRDSTQSYWAGLEYSHNSDRIRLNWSQRDIDTDRAIERGIQATTYSVGYHTRRVRPVVIRGGLSYQDYNDGNNGFDVRGAVRYAIPGFEAWQVGVDLAYRDSDFEAVEYYTPDSLVIGMGRLLYRRRFLDNLVVAGDVGLGGGHDTLNGTRWVTNGSARLDYEVTRRLRGGLGTNFSVVPGYRSVTVLATLGYRF